LPTHRIICSPVGSASVSDLLTGRSVELGPGDVVFDQFAARTTDGWYKLSPEFDCALGYHGEQEVLLGLKQVSFVLEKISCQRMSSRWARTEGADGRKQKD